jgi:hypothetical protein
MDIHMHLRMHFHGTRPAFGPHKAMIGNLYPLAWFYTDPVFSLPVRSSCDEEVSGPQTANLGIFIGLRHEHPVGIGTNFQIHQECELSPA